ncbi:MAG TPA: hypothetical protein VFR78_12475 [Pyrinomonadaceae bacterium]|nr:hypothetical protein [Pyrinomonadaceae bacterium]
MPDTETLTPEQVAEIEARKPFQYGTMVSLTVAQRDALCRSLRAAWAELERMPLAQSALRQLDELRAANERALSENTALRTQNQTQAESITYFQENEKSLRARLAQCEGSRRVHELDNHHNALACGYCAGPLKDELTRIQAQLAQVEQERDDLRRKLTIKGRALVAERGRCR